MLKRKKPAITALLVVGVIGVLIGNYFYNVHCVIPHQIYRSAQLSARGLTTLTHFIKVKTIINLRGVNPAEAWYKKELDFSQKNHITHIDIALNATRLPSQETLITLTDTLLTADKPILVHCFGGADRTGLASAIVKILHNSSLAEAKEQYSWRYYAFKHNNVGEQIISAYEQWLSAHELTHSRDNFLAFVQAKDIYYPHQK